MKLLLRFYSNHAHYADAHLFLFIVLFAVFSIACNKEKKMKKKKKKKTPPYYYFYLRDVSIPQKKCTLCSNVKFNSVFYSCTNCLANSVLYSRDHKQGFILYCISTHWTIILMRDCKENLLGRIIRTLFVRWLGPSLVGAVKVGSERFFFFKETAYTIYPKKQLWII